MERGSRCVLCLLKAQMQTELGVFIIPAKAFRQIDLVGRGNSGIAHIERDPMGAVCIVLHRALPLAEALKGLHHRDLLGVGGQRQTERCTLVGDTDVGTLEFLGDFVIVVQRLEGGFGVANVRLGIVHIQLIVGAAVDLLPAEHHLNRGSSGISDIEIQPGVVVPGGNAHGGTVGIEHQILCYVGLVQQPCHLERGSVRSHRFLKAQMQTELGVFIIPAKALGQIHRECGGDGGVAHIERDPMGAVCVILHCALPLGKARKRAADRRKRYKTSREKCAE